MNIKKKKFITDSNIIQENIQNTVRFPLERLSFVNLTKGRNRDPKLSIFLPKYFNLKYLPKANSQRRGRYRSCTKITARKRVYACPEVQERRHRKPIKITLQFAIVKRPCYTSRVWIIDKIRVISTETRRSWFSQQRQAENFDEWECDGGAVAICLRKRCRVRVAREFISLKPCGIIRENGERRKSKGRWDGFPRSQPPWKSGNDAKTGGFARKTRSSAFCNGFKSRHSRGEG